MEKQKTAMQILFEECEDYMRSKDVAMPYHMIKQGILELKANEERDMIIEAHIAGQRIYGIMDVRKDYSESHYNDKYGEK